MKKNCLRLTSVLLSLAMVFSAVVLSAGRPALPAAAGGVEAKAAKSGAVSTVSTFEEAAELLTDGKTAQAPAAAKASTKNSDPAGCGGDCEYCPSIVIPGIGQSDVYLLDENGNRAKDEDGNDISAWPVMIDTDYLIKALVLPLAKMLITQRDDGFTDYAAETVGKALEKSAIGLDAQPVSNLEVVDFPQSVAACTPEERDYIYRTIPLQDYTKVAGEDHLYFLAYNSFGNHLDIAEDLYNMIQQVKRETGHSKVNLVPISLGSTVFNTLIQEYPQVKNDLSEVVFIVPALDGSRLVGDLYKGELSTDDEMLYRDLLPSLMDYEYYSYLINIAIRIIPKQILLDLLDKIVAELRDVMLVNCTMLWGLVPSGDYDELAEKYLSDDAHAEVRRQTDIFHRAQVNSRANILALTGSGVRVYDVVDYNFPLYSFVPSSKTHNGDGLIHLDSESLGATSGRINEPLPAGYTQKDTYCSAPGQHNHISPDGIVDASTGVLPETTFYFYNQDHEGTGRNDVIMKLATEILLYDNLMDVHSMPERFPQFNVGRETKGLRNDLLPAAKSIDQSTLSAEDAAELAGAIAQCDAMLETTVVVYEEFTSSVERLENIMIKIGARPARKDETPGKIAAAVCKLLSDAMYKYYGPRGFSDWNLK